MVLGLCTRHMRLTWKKSTFRRIVESRMKSCRTAAPLATSARFLGIEMVVPGGPRDYLAIACDAQTFRVGFIGLHPAFSKLITTPCKKNVYLLYLNLSDQKISEKAGFMRIPRGMLRAVLKTYRKREDNTRSLKYTLRRVTTGCIQRSSQ